MSQKDAAQLATGVAELGDLVSGPGPFGNDV